MDLTSDGPTKFNKLADVVRRSSSPERRSRSCSTASCSRTPRSRQPTLRRRRSQISGNFTPGRGRRPRQAHQVRRAAGAAQAAHRRERVADARQGPAPRRDHRRHHRPRPGRDLHARLLPAARPRRDRRASCSAALALYDRVDRRGSCSVLGGSATRAHARRRHRPHRVGRCHRRLVRRLLRALEGRGARRRAPCARRVDRGVHAVVPHHPRRRPRVAHRCGGALLLAIGSVRGFALFLGLSTLLDLFVAYFFMHPLVSLMARRRRSCACRASASRPASTRPRRRVTT